MLREFPVPRSTVIAGIEWLGEHIPFPPPAPGEDPSPYGRAFRGFDAEGPCARGDTFPMAWAADGELYTSAGDPHWGQKADGLDFERFTGFPPDYRITKVNDMVSFTGFGGSGAKPSGVVSVDGALYLAFQNICGKKAPAHGSKSQHGSDAAIVCSRDFGRTWVPDVDQFAAPMFPGHKFGGPAFINFGRDNAGARDDFVYAVSSDQWDNGSHLRLGRVPRDSILDAEAWEWVSVLGPAGGPEWTADLENAVPILSDERHISLPEMVYLAGISRCLLLTWHLHQDFSNQHGSSFIVYESPEPWGPFAVAHYEEMWEAREVNPYCPRLPLKWLEADGLTGWLQFSGNWQGQSPHYRSNVRRFRLRLRPGAERKVDAGGSR